FGLALIGALAFHVLLGLFLRLNPLNAAPSFANSKTPLTMRFVEVPPNAKTIPEIRETPNASDANRKAGPLEPAPGREISLGRKAVTPGITVAPRRAQEPNRAAPRMQAQNQIPQPSARSQQPDLPDIQTPDSIQSSTGSGDYAPKLAKSLQNLDQF